MSKFGGMKVSNALRTERASGVFAAHATSYRSSKWAILDDLIWMVRGNSFRHSHFHVSHCCISTCSHKSNHKYLELITYAENLVMHTKTAVLFFNGRNIYHKIWALIYEWKHEKWFGKTLLFRCTTRIHVLFSIQLNELFSIIGIYSKSNIDVFSHCFVRVVQKRKYCLLNMGLALSRSVLIRHLDDDCGAIYDPKLTATRFLYQFYAENHTKFSDI